MRDKYLSLTLPTERLYHCEWCGKRLWFALKARWRVSALTEPGPVRIRGHAKCMQKCRARNSHLYRKKK